MIAGYGLPHARGGVSYCRSRCRIRRQSSPRTWGCFHGTRTYRPHYHVFPLVRAHLASRRPPSLRSSSASIFPNAPFTARPRFDGPAGNACQSALPGRRSLRLRSARAEASSAAFRGVCVSHPSAMPFPHIPPLRPHCRGPLRALRFFLSFRNVIFALRSAGETGDSSGA